MLRGHRMILDKYTQLHYFEIWEPRWKDKVVLLAAHKVGTHNKIKFTKTPSMGTEPYYIDGKTVKKYKKESNGRLMCYAVPLDKLEPLELSENSYLDLK